MDERHKLFTLLTQNFVQQALININEQERRRTSCPDVTLTDLEFEVLVGITQGRNKNELNEAIENSENKISYAKDSYNALAIRLFQKLEARTMPQVVYKAMKIGLIE